MADSFSTEVIVKRRARDGCFVYTCDELPGLFVASNDDRTAYNDLPKSIQALIKLDFGVMCRVTHKIGYAEFADRMRMTERAQTAVSERTDELMDGGLHISFGVYPMDDDHVT